MLSFGKERAWRLEFAIEVAATGLRQLEREGRPRGGHTWSHLALTLSLSLIKLRKGVLGGSELSELLVIAEEIAVEADAVADQNQRARVYRGLAKVYALLGEHEYAQNCRDLMRGIKSVGSDVTAKNTTA